MFEAFATPTPMVGTPKLVASNGSPLVDIHGYYSVIGKLKYVCIIRPEIAFCVNKLS